MAIVEAASPDPGMGNLEIGDFYPSWGPNRYQTATFLLFDVAPLFTPFAMISGIRKASYIRKLIQAYRGADKATDAARLAAVGQAMVDMPIRTGLIMAGGTTLVSGQWVIYNMGTDVAQVSVGIYLDREGRVRTFLPSDQLIESRGGQGVVLPAARRPRSFFSEDGIARLSEIERSRTPLNIWPVATGTTKIQRGNPLAEGPGSRPRRGPSRRGKTISPYCPRHKQRHWCPVTRGKFS